MENPIEHKATVILVDGDRIDVEMIVEGACASCKSAKACGMGESREKIVSLVTATASSYQTGDEVMVSIEKKMGMKAATYAYIIPLFVMLVVLFVLFESGSPDTVAGLSALGSIVVYYIILYFFRHRIEKDIIFKLRKI